jgi:O-antigen ligase
MNLGRGLVVGSGLFRWLRVGRLTRLTPLDLPLALFLASAALAAAIAPDLAAALVRLYLFLGAVALFYALVNAGPGTLRLFAYALVLAGAALSLYFATQHDWAENPAKFAVVGGLGRSLNQAVPDLGLYKPHPNVVGAILAVAGPVALACLGDEARRLWQSRRASVLGLLGLAVSGLGGLLILAGVIVSESRTAWLALAVAAGLGGWYWLAGKIEGGAKVARGRVFWAVAGGGLLVALVAVLLRPALLTAVFGALPGPNSAVGRMELFGRVWRLAQDTPFTGGGLDAFPGLYSTYILGIPFLFLTHAHNAYLHVFAEQGWAGLTGYAGLMIAGAWAAARRLRQAEAAEAWPVVAGALGIVVILVHGIGEGSLVASRAVPVLLIPAGLALGAIQPSELQSASGLGSMRRRLAAAAIAMLAVAVAGLVFQRPVLAAWHANQGALAFHKVDLAGWPTGKWDDGSRSAYYAPAEAELQMAVEYQPGNRAANYRLGLAALSRRDFVSAAGRLQTAYDADTGHRGVVKALAFTYVWLGDFEAAQPLLAHIPEARSELVVYGWWWGVQGRTDLGQRAYDMATRLGS